MMRTKRTIVLTSSSDSIIVDVDYQIEKKKTLSIASIAVRDKYALVTVAIVDVKAENVLTYPNHFQLYCMYCVSASASQLLLKHITQREMLPYFYA